VDAEARAWILAVATDFPRLWHDPHTPDRERKRMVRLLMEDVTLIKTAEGLTTHIRFRRGATTTLTLARALNAWQRRETSTEIVALIDQLLDQHTDGNVATLLNAQGYVSGTGRPFQSRIVQHIRHDYRLRSRYERLRARGMLTQHEIAGGLHVTAATVKVWGRRGLLPRHVCNDKSECLYEPLGRTPRSKCRGDVCQTGDSTTFFRIRPMRCSVKRSPWLVGPESACERYECLHRETPHRSCV
jgi:DNA-binding transcriptional regulator YiaG